MNEKAKLAERILYLATKRFCLFRLIRIIVLERRLDAVKRALAYLSLNP